MVLASVGHQCRDCVAEGRKSQRQARTHFGGTAAGQSGTVTKALMGINAAVFLLTLALYGVGALGSLRTPLHTLGAVLGITRTDGPERSYIGAFPDLGIVSVGIDDGAFHRLLTSMFLHYGLIHLLLNMYVLWILGRPLEAALGRWRFLALYLIAGLGGSVAVDLFSPLSFTAGASGAIFGLFSAYFLILRKLGRDAAAILPVIVINLVLTFAFADYISVAGHLGGFVIGAVCGAGLAYAPRQNRTLVQALVLGGAFVALMAIVIGLAALR